MRRPSEKTKQERAYGTGHGADYLPHIKAREFSSSGTCANIIDWKHGRTIELLSQVEKWAYYLLRWDDSVVDIREQFPLPLDETTKIAKLKGYNPVQRGKSHMITNFLVDYANGTQAAFSVKADDKQSHRSLEKAEIEKTYWEGYGIPHKVIYKKDLDIRKAKNIANVILFYDPETVRPGNRIDLIKHLIATKEIQTNMSVMLDYDEIGEKYGITK